MNIKKNSKKACLRKNKKIKSLKFSCDISKNYFLYTKIFIKANFFSFYQKNNFIFICKKKNISKIPPITLIDVAGEEYLEKRKAKGIDRRGKRGTISKIDRTALDFYGAVLRIERIVVQIHHAGQGRRESHAISDRSVSGQPNEFITLGHIV